VRNPPKLVSAGLAIRNTLYQSEEDIKAAGEGYVLTGAHALTPAAFPVLSFGPRQQIGGVEIAQGCELSDGEGSGNVLMGGCEAGRTEL
jgi:hypothetical protein